MQYNWNYAQLKIYFHVYSYRIDIKTLKAQQSVSPRDSSVGASYSRLKRDSFHIVDQNKPLLVYLLLMSILTFLI